MTDAVRVGEIEARRGSRAFGFLPVAVGADGGDIGIPVHVLAGAKEGPRLVVLSTAHGYEIGQISVIRELLSTLDPGELSGDVIFVPVCNPVAFEMGARCTWMDALWGDSGNMNRLWPGRPNGWLTERFCHAISAAVFPGADVVIDMHGRIDRIAVSYGYLGAGGPGDLEYDISRVFGHEMLVRSTKKELEEKRQTSGTSRAYLSEVGIASYSCEIGEFWGLGGERASDTDERLFRGVPEVGVTGVSNVMKHLGMIDGTPIDRRTQVAVQPELVLRPVDGGLLIPHFGPRELGTVIEGGTRLGTVISPYSFEMLEELFAPFPETLLLATTDAKPFAKVLPGDYAFICADASLTQQLD